MDGESFLVTIMCSLLKLHCKAFRPFNAPLTTLTTHIFLASTVHSQPPTPDEDDSLAQVQGGWQREFNAPRVAEELLELCSTLVEKSRSAPDAETQKVCMCRQRVCQCVAVVFENAVVSMLNEKSVRA